MKELNTNGVYTITDDMKEQMKDFYGNYATEEETAQTIKKFTIKQITSLIPTQQ